MTRQLTSKREILAIGYDESGLRILNGAGYSGMRIGGVQRDNDPGYFKTSHHTSNKRGAMLKKQGNRSLPRFLACLDGSQA